MSAAAPAPDTVLDDVLLQPESNPSVATRDAARTTLR
jgi:hypothetical protein